MISNITAQTLGVTEDSDNIDIEGETVSSLSMGDEQDLMIDDFNEPTSSITPDQQASSKSMYVTHSCIGHWGTAHVTRYAHELYCCPSISL